SARALTGLLLLELVFLAFVAGAAGVTMGYFVASALLPDVASTLRGLYGADVPGALSLRPAWWASGVGIALAGMLVSAAESLWRVSRLPLLASAQPRAWVRASQSALRWQAGAAAGMLALAYAVLELGSGLFAGFAILGALLLGSALALPVVLAILLGLAQKPAHGPLATWFWADTRQQLPGLSLALMALMLALATNIGVGTMVSSFRTTLTGWLDQRLASELYVAARTEEESVALHAWLTPRVDAVLPVWSADDQIADQPAEVFGASDHATYRDNWPLLTSVPDVWNRLARGEAVIINEQLSRRENLGPGDSITLSRGWRATVAGVYSDYGNPVAQVIVGLDEWNQLYPDAPRLRYGVRIAPDKVQAIARELTADFGLPSGNIVDQASLKTLSLDVFERTFSVTAALNVLTLGVAGLAMFASLMTLSGMRLPQLAPVWAAGVTRRRLALLELARTMMLAALTLIAALPVGIGLAWVLLAVVNVEAFGWRLPMHLFPADWAQLGVLGFLAALLAALIPVRRLARLAPSDLLRVFANER
ncbi:MAG: ABC transporter permease, partial [Alphaproteobacteria bacterium]|nr:ABC transporter permease [Alphaproteobacteria bacterium]